MGRLPEDITIRDLYQWISDGYVMINGAPARLSEADYMFDDDGDRGSDLAYQRPDGFRFDMLTDEDDVPVALADVYCHWPKCGSINTALGVALYVQRTQRRQWRRTFNGRCVDVRVPLHWQATKLHGRAAIRSLQHLSVPVITELFNPTYVSVEDAVDRLQGKRALTVAVDRNVILGGWGAESPVEIYYRGELCGTLDDNGTHIANVSTRNRVNKKLEGVG